MRRDISTMDASMNPVFRKLLAAKGLTGREYLERRDAVYFSEETTTISEDIREVELLASPNLIIAIAPRIRHIDYGVHVSERKGIYLLMSEDGARRWTVYDNDCSHDAFLELLRPDVDWAPVVTKYTELP